MGKGALSLAKAKEIAVFLKRNANKIIEKRNKVFILNQKVDCEKNKSENKVDEKIAIIKVAYIKGFKVLLYFNNDEQRIVNFLPFFQNFWLPIGVIANLKTVKSLLLKMETYFGGQMKKSFFRSLRFTMELSQKKPKEEILYII